MDTTYTSDEGALAGDRSEFLMKTYAHVVGALLAFVAIEYVLFASGIAQAIAAPLANNWLLVIGGLVLVSYLASRFATPESSRTAQYAVLAGFTIVEALIFVPLIITAEVMAGPAVLPQAAFITIGMTIALSAIVYIFRTNFSFLGPFLAIGGIAALGLIVAALIFGFELGLFFSFAMITYAAAAILYQTSQIQREYPPHAYVAASIGLVTSVFLLLWYVVSAFIGSSE